MGTNGVVEITLMETEPISVMFGFEHVYRCEYPGLVAVATALTGDLRDGEDAVQDTMVRAFVRWNEVGWPHSGATIDAPSGASHRSGPQHR